MLFHLELLSRNADRSFFFPPSRCLGLTERMIKVETTKINQQIDCAFHPPRLLGKIDKARSLFYTEMRIHYGTETTA